MDRSSPATSRDLAGRRVRRAVPLLAAAAVAGVLLAGCSNDALALAREACGHVHRSLSDFHAAQRVAGADATAAHHDAEQALQQLQDAIPLAAAATSANPIWNPLQTTLQLSNRTSEANLVGALTRQCAAATNPASQNPGTSTTTPPTTTTSPAH